MEENIKIPLADGHVIHGVLRGKLEAPLIIFVHGFTGYKDEHMFFNGARFFEKHGISTFRFNLYGEDKDERKLNDCTLSLHAEDLDTVIDYFKDKVPSITVVGHSFGGVVVLLSKKQKFDKVVLWDSTGNPNEVTDPARYVKELDKYYNHEWGVASTFSKDMYEENKTIKPNELVKNIHVPIKIIVAGAGDLVEAGEQLFENANEPKSFTKVWDAHHNFNENGVEETLFQVTLEWIK